MVEAAHRQVGTLIHARNTPPSCTARCARSSTEWARCFRSDWTADYILQTLTTPADTAAFFVEPVLGEGGNVPANERFLAGLRERADKYGILLVVDEVQSGFGRTG